MTGVNHLFRVDPLWSSGLSRQLRSWMRKVVGSNPGDDLYRIDRFLLWRSIAKRRLICDEANWNDKQCDAKQEEV